jgi:Na+-driven multidrug efflux pump
MNYALLKSIGGDGINAFAIINYVSSFSSMLFIGTSQGLQPIRSGRGYIRYHQ